jgi:hypothetical protein
MSDLQPLYAELAKEAERRTYQDEDGRIQKALELGRSLGGAAGEEGGLPEAVKEASACLAWLKEQPLAKNEDGARYPASAYAYVPDPAQPGDWKLRLWEDTEKKTTRAQLNRAAAALSPGGWRGQRADIPKEDLSAVKRQVRAAYRALEVAEEDIPRWVKEPESRALLNHLVSLEEAVMTRSGVATVTIITPGFNASAQRYYPAETLARACKVFEGVKMYADHPTSLEDKERPERSIKDWVATLKNVRVDAHGALAGEALVVEPWMEAKLATLRDKGMLKEMGISINAVGTATRGEIRGVQTTIIERIVRVRSVDFVTEPGAGGEVQIFEASPADTDLDLVGLETIRERRPDLVKAIETQLRTELQQEVKKTMDLEQQLKEARVQLETATKALEETNNQLAETAKARAVAEAKVIITEAISKSALPPPSKEKLIKQFAGADKADGLGEAIKAEEAYVAALAESSKPRDMGLTVEPKVSGDQLKESFRRLGLSEAGADIAARGR